MSNISSASNCSLQMQQNLFRRIDTNADGKVSKGEFLSARPDGVSADQASAIFSMLDTAGTGSLTQGQLFSGEAQQASATDSGSASAGNLASDVVAAILQLLQQNDSAAASVDGVNAAHRRPSASEMFSKMDANGDGSVSKDEFLAARPANVSEQQALALFNSIDTQGSGSISLAQFTDHLQAEDAGNQSANAAPPPVGGGDSAQAKTYDPLDTNKDGHVSLQELLAGLYQSPSDDQNAAASSATTSNASPLDKLLADLTKAVQAYDATSRAGSTSLDLASLLQDA